LPQIQIRDAPESLTAERRHQQQRGQRRDPQPGPNQRVLELLACCGGASPVPRHRAFSFPLTADEECKRRANTHCVDLQRLIPE
jgi:hypothetical protein